MLHWDPPHDFFQLFPINLSKLFDGLFIVVTLHFAPFDFHEQSNSEQTLTSVLKAIAIGRWSVICF